MDAEEAEKSAPNSNTKKHESKNKERDAKKAGGTMPDSQDLTKTTEERAQTGCTQEAPLLSQGSEEEDMSDCTETTTEEEKADATAATTARGKHLRTGIPKLTEDGTERKMPRKKFLTLEEAVEMVLADDSAQVADVVLLPPPSADDVVTDEEEGDSDIAVVGALPSDVAGEVEVHTTGTDKCEEALQEVAPPRPKKASRDCLVWRRTTQYSGPIVETELQPLRVSHAELVDEEPFDLFARLLNKEIIGLITDESNRYAQQQNDHNVCITEKDTLQFVAILFLSGYHKLPRSDLYWSKAEDLGVPLVANTMSRAKFRLIKRYIHACNSENLEKGDKMAKVRPLLRLVNRSLQQFGIFSKNLSVDEQMVPYFGRHSCKMFIKGKPIRFGYKQWILCSSSGYPFNIDIYCGKTEGESTNVPLGTRVVLNALKCVDVPTNHVIFMDNFFTSHALLQELKNVGSEQQEPSGRSG
ncbi:hypothetical protein HPB49_009594 [Dermacentor silvarum]|uniref:Uncharacterized protein n=1 Tax=Dermacentor silvarum TaxID=543639 RepID=A0ACB8DNY0_DERSI|nr:hypothetical protein HPB49_009594 [Dermacentor silvarum]